MRCLLLLIILSFQSHAAVYRWVDKQGNVHFSDKADHPKAVEIKVNINTDQLQVSFPKQRKSMAPEQAAVILPQATITSPIDQQTIRNNQGDFNIITQITPKLLPSQRVQLIMDGEPLGMTQTHSTFELKNINRGTHQFSVNIINSQSQVIDSSDTITVFLHRAHQNNPMHRPGKKPQPRN